MSAKQVFTWRGFAVVAAVVLYFFWPIAAPFRP
jgi:hypothetical protein